MERVGACDVLGAFVSELRKIDSGEEAFAAAEQYGRDGDVHFVDQTGLKVLADGRGSAADAHIQFARGFAGALQRGVNAIRDEMKGGASLHLNGGARMMCEDEDLGVVGRVLTPPAFPLVIGPGTAGGAEHIPAHNPRANAVETAFRKIVVDAGGAVGRGGVVGHHFPESARGAEPIVQVFAADAEGVLEALVWPGAESIEGDCKTINTQFGHSRFFRFYPGLILHTEDGCVSDKDAVLLLKTFLLNVRDCSVILKP